MRRSGSPMSRRAGPGRRRRLSSSSRNSGRSRCSTAPPKRRAPSSSSPPSGTSIWCRATAAPSATASASAAKAFTWQGLVNITRKAEWPDWTPPPEMIQRQPYLPRFMAGGPGNPLGARAMYLGTTVYRIHGTNRPDTIGTAVSSGCFRLVNARRRRPLRARACRHQGDHPAEARTVSATGFFASPHSISLKSVRENACAHFEAAC